ncbi:MAG: YqjF family protein [Blastocatellia bacterium]
MRKFLTAKWKDLIMANYEVDPAILVSRIPIGTTLDFHDGRCFVSLVGFMFLDTRVMDFLIPFHVNFEEVNLRFYVRRETKDGVRRGVVFIKEIVPRFAIAAVARTLYGEPYERWKMSNFRDEENVRYTWEKGNCTNTLSVRRGESLGVPLAGSHGEFIIEHYWGYTQRSKNRTDEYKVEHPQWELFAVENEHIDLDFGANYGSEYAFLNNKKPYSVLLASGSEITVYKGEIINR